MGKHVFLTVLAVSLALLAIAMLIPGQPKEQAVNLPWQIDVLPNGHTRVFGITLGETTLAQAQMQFAEEPEVTLFSKDESVFGVEAYFDQLTLSGIRAKAVLSMGLDQETLQTMYQRGVRISKAVSGVHKITLTGDDLALVMGRPVTAITYLPRADLDADVVRRRFGEPGERVREADNGIEHWLYADRGLDVALHDEKKDVLQYVLPADFSTLRRPLLPAQ